MALSRLLIPIILVLWPLSFAAHSGRQTIYLAEMAQCPGKEDLPISGYNFSLQRGNRSQNFINGDVVMTESFPKGFKINLSIKVCEDMKDKSTCKPFLSQLATNDICAMLRTPLPIYRSFLHSTKPPMLCPLRNTTYQVRNLLVTNDLVRYMQRSDKRIYYFQRFTGTHNGREVVCFEFFMYASTLKRSK